MDKKEEKLANIIMDKIEKTKINIFNARNSSEKIENILLGEQVREASESDKADGGLLCDIIRGISIINYNIVGIKRINEHILDEIEIER